MSMVRSVIRFVGDPESYEQMGGGSIVVVSLCIPSLNKVQLIDRHPGRLLMWSWWSPGGLFGRQAMVSGGPVVVVMVGVT